MASLYEIDENIRRCIDSIFDNVDEETGEIADADFSALEELKAERKVKIENIVLYAKNLASEASAIKDEEIILAERRKRLERKCERLKGIVASSMEQHEEKELSSPRYCAKIRFSEATEITDENLIPEEFVNVKVEKKPDKTAIKKAIKAGQEVSGAKLVVNVNLSIK